jgi:hypothetical protein
MGLVAAGRSREVAGVAAVAVDGDDGDSQQQGFPAPTSGSRRSSSRRRSARASRRGEGRPVAAGSSGDGGDLAGEVGKRRRRGEWRGNEMARVRQGRRVTLSTPERRWMLDNWPSTASARARPTRRRRRETTPVGRLGWAGPVYRDR